MGWEPHNSVEPSQMGSEEAGELLSLLSVV